MRPAHREISEIHLGDWEVITSDSMHREYPGTPASSHVLASWIVGPKLDSRQEAEEALNDLRWILSYYYAVFGSRDRRMAE